MGGCSSEHGQVWTVPQVDILIHWPWSQQTQGHTILVPEIDAGTWGHVPEAMERTPGSASSSCAFYQRCDCGQGTILHVSVASSVKWEP